MSVLTWQPIREAARVLFKAAVSRSVPSDLQGDPDLDVARFWGWVQAFEGPDWLEAGPDGPDGSLRCDSADVSCC